MSTPSFAEAGIDTHYRQSDQRRYHLPCPSCGLKQPLTWPENIDFERALRVCRECRAELDVLAAGAWVPEAPGNTRIRGYHIPGLLSPWANIPNMIEASEAMTPVAPQQFYNADLGETFSPPGGGLSPEELDRCRRPYALDDYRGQRCDMGVDVGLTLHVVIREHSDEPSQPRRLWFAGQVGWEDLDGLMERFNAPRIVIDAQPEAYMAGTFALRHRSQTWLAYYGRREVGIDWRKGETGKPHTMHLNRTEMLDAVMAHFRDQSLPIPRDARRLGARFRSADGFAEYYRELLAPKRVMEHDANGLPVHGFLGHLIGAACPCRGGVHDRLSGGDEWSERAAGGARSLLVATQGRGGAEAAARRGARRALARARGDRSDAGAVA